MATGVRRLRRPVAAHVAEAPTPASAGPRARRIGILGGSFNPAHEGHRRISIEALRRLDLDRVWWLVAPQNPLKLRRDTAPLEERMARARAIARHPRIIVTDIEARLGTRYTAATLPRLVARFADVRFVWLMGADNLATLDRWHRWNDIMHALPIAVFAREPYVYEALAGRAARRYEGARWTGDLDLLVCAAPPAWGFLRLRTHPAASSAIRAAGDWSAARQQEED